MVGFHLPKIKGATRLETVENVCIALIIAGAVVLSIGIGSTAIATKGITAIVAMMGAVISFTFTVALVFTWLLKEFVG